MVFGSPLKVIVLYLFCFSTTLFFVHVFEIWRKNHGAKIKKTFTSTLNYLTNEQVGINEYGGQIFFLLHEKKYFIKNCEHVGQKN